MANLFSLGMRMDPTKSRSWIITEEAEVMSFKNGMRPVHPGEILRDELDALGLSPMRCRRRWASP